jgi:phosphohistidine phosphatase
MDLILWRHAEAVDEAHPDAAVDLVRTLTPRGERQAQRMAQWLDRVLPPDTRILVSPALRCQQTVQPLARKFQTREEIALGRSAADLLALARWPKRRQPVLVVGHQPTLGAVAAALMTGAADPDAAPSWSVKKGAVWWLRQRERSGSGEVVLLAVRSPGEV